MGRQRFYCLIHLVFFRRFKLKVGVRRKFCHGHRLFSPGAACNLSGMVDGSADQPRFPVFRIGENLALLIICEKGLLEHILCIERIAGMGQRNAIDQLLVHFDDFFHIGIILCQLHAEPPPSVINSILGRKMLPDFLFFIGFSDMKNRPDSTLLNRVCFIL